MILYNDIFLDAPFKRRIKQDFDGLVAAKEQSQFCLLYIMVLYIVQGKPWTRLGAPALQAPSMLGISICLLPWGLIYVDILSKSRAAMTIPSIAAQPPLRESVDGIGGSHSSSGQHPSHTLETDYD